LSGPSMPINRGAIADNLDSKRIQSCGYHRGRMLECVPNLTKLLDSKPNEV